jgi:hypothetical protein
MNGGSDGVRVLGKDPIPWIRSNASMFFDDGKVSIDALKTRVIDDARAVGAAVEVDDFENWAIVAGDRDWVPNTDLGAPADVFLRVCAAPDRGQNAVRGEVLLTAFCGSVITARGREVRAVVGSVSAASTLLEYIARRSGWVRVIAFRDIGWPKA